MSKDKKKRGGRGGKKAANRAIANNLDRSPVEFGSANLQDNDGSAAHGSSSTPSQEVTPITGSTSMGSAVLVQDTSLPLKTVRPPAVASLQGTAENESSSCTDGTTGKVASVHTSTPPARRTRSQVAIKTVVGVDPRDELKSMQSGFSVSLHKNFFSAGRRILKIVSPRIFVGTPL